MVELEGVTRSYGAEQALGPLDLTLPEGAVGLLGPNGAGKSTLLRILLGMMPPTTGTVRVLGEEVTPGSTSLRRRIGYVPEGDSLFPGLTGVEATTYAGELVGMRRVDALKRAHEVLDYVQLSEERYRFVEGYSTGMKQRLKLAQALVHDPELLILDEPTEGVDPEARRRLLELIHALEKEHGMKLLVSTHILPDVERLATHALVLNVGRVAALGSLEELKASSTKAYFVRVNGAPETLTAHLDARGIKWERHHPNVRVDVADPREVLKLVREAGLVVRHLTPVTLSLEEAFEQAVSLSQTLAPSPSLGGEAPVA
ncbi:MAG TPA: ABC transporter ATP-binding protein [Candidatus Thermoplasmatota archaeon]|nr:ABC transporter ATP-binding protein [Candidatus Thermoplasmatota archaeon]